MKALGLFSGGLDSILATKLILDQGFEVTALNFTSPFISTENGKHSVAEAAERLGVPLKVITMTDDYMRVVRNPVYGYGKNINPCVDCRIFMLKKAKKYAREIGAVFIFTGEVLDERPMSQNFAAIKLVEEASGLQGSLLRPLSAKLLPKTKVEKAGLVDRERLLGIRGRSRKVQIKLAKEYKITFYPNPAGGCLLTCKEYSKKLRDLFNHKKQVSMDDVALLKVGRHFRVGKNKIIVGRNEEENQFLISNKAPNDYFFEVSNVAGPIAILKGAKSNKAIETASELTAYYSDSKDSKVVVNFGRVNLEKSVTVSVPSQKTVRLLQVGAS
jgi:tRNA-uridine 2-sulfurtransferase